MQLSYRDLRFVWIFFVATTLQFASPSWLLGIWKIPCWRWEIQHGNVALVPLLLYHLCNICLRAVCCLQLVAAWWPCSFGHAACWRMCRSTLCPAEPGTVWGRRGWKTKLIQKLSVKPCELLRRKVPIDESWPGRRLLHLLVVILGRNGSAHSCEGYV